MTALQEIIADDLKLTELERQLFSEICEEWADGDPQPTPEVCEEWADGLPDVRWAKVSMAACKYRNLFR